MADLNVTSTTYGQNITTTSNNMLQAAQDLANGIGDPGTNLTVLMRSSAINDVTTGMMNEEKKAFQKISQ